MALCVDKEQFYKKLEQLKQSKVGYNKFIDDELYKNAKIWLQNSKKIMKNVAYQSWKFKHSKESSGN